MTNLSRWLAAPRVGAVVAVLLLVACTGGSSDEGSGTASVPPTSEEAATEPSAVEEDAESGSGDEVVDDESGAEDDAGDSGSDASETDEPGDAVSETEPVEVIASATAPIDWVEGGELEMAVNSMEVAGDLLRVVMTFTAQLPRDERVALGAVLAANDSFPGTGVAPELIDPVNLKAYELVAGGVEAGTSLDLTHDSPRTIVFYFAAPEDPVESFDIQVSSLVPMILDVPLQQ